MNIDDRLDAIERALIALASDPRPTPATISAVLRGECVHEPGPITYTSYPAQSDCRKCGARYFLDDRFKAGA